MIKSVDFSRRDRLSRYLDPGKNTFRLDCGLEVFDLNLTRPAKKPKDLIAPPVSPAAMQQLRPLKEKAEQAKR